MQKVSVRQVRHDWAELLSRVRYGGERLVVTRHGAPRAAIVPLEDLALLEQLRSSAVAKTVAYERSHTRKP